MKALAPDVPGEFDKWPLGGGTFAGPYPASANRAYIESQFKQYHGAPPAMVLWVKPGMWIAGPLPEPKAGAEVGSAPAAPVEQTTSEHTQAPLDIIAAGPGRAEQWTQQSLI